MYFSARLDEDVSTALGVKVLVKCLERSKQAGQACFPWRTPALQRKHRTQKTGQEAKYSIGSLKRT